MSRLSEADFNRIVDKKGFPLEFHVITGQQHEAAHTDIVFDFLEVKPKAMLMDKGFISHKITENMKKSGTIAVTPPKSNAVNQRKFFPKALYKARSWVENFFCRLKKFRRTEFRFEKKQCTFLRACRQLNISFLPFLTHPPSARQ